MLCQRCGKEPATVHLTEIKSSKKSELHLCQKCAEEQGVALKQTLDISHLLAGLAGTVAGKTKQRKAKKTLTCTACGHSFADFQATGRLGCPADYGAFREEIGVLIEKIQESQTHVGKVPERVDPAARRAVETGRVEEALRRAVAREDFEEAARLRDQVRRLRGEGVEAGDAG